MEEIKEKCVELSKNHWGDDECHLVGKGIQSMYTQTEKIIRSYMGEVVEDWISVEERLPEEPKYIEDSYIVQQENVIDPFSAYWDGKEWTDTNDEPIKRVIAWQPLPKRYKPNKK